MPKPRSPNHDRARTLYMKNNGEIALVDIAKKLGETDGTIRGWKSKDSWDRELLAAGKNRFEKNVERNAPNNGTLQKIDKNKERSELKKTEKKITPKNSENMVVKSKSSHLIGNKHAVGNRGGYGAPEGNKYALKTHEFETIFWTDDIIDPEEKNMLDFEYDKYFLQKQLVQSLKIRERRMLKRIQELKNLDSDLVIESFTENEGIIFTEYSKGSSNKVTESNSSKTSVSRLKEILRVEEALTRVQGRLQKSVEVLHKMEFDTFNSGLMLEEKLADEVKIREYVKASLDLWEYCKIKKPSFYTDDKKHLIEICRALQEFEYDDNELLVLNLPPRHGKTLTVGEAAQWYLGRNKDLKIIVASYNQLLSQKISKEVRNSISEVKSSEDICVFNDIFPKVQIAKGSSSVGLWKLQGARTNNYLATSPSGTLTGFGADIIIIDDIVKNEYEANHRGILEDHFNWFKNTLYSRLEGKRKIILVMTRWSTKDLSGQVVEMYKAQERKIRVITKKAWDGSKMLSEKDLSKEQYEQAIMVVGEDIVRANYDQEPIDLKGALYGEFSTYSEVPKFESIRSMCDTADSGDDYLCNIIYGLHKDANDELSIYVLDVYYTQEGMDKTEKELARRLLDFKVSRAAFESNFGGEAFAKVIQQKYKEIGGSWCSFPTFKQIHNKEARILSMATTVTRKIKMPEDWKKRYAKFAQHVTEYQRIGKNPYDDAVDTLTMIAEKEKGPTKFIG
ncbi:MAG: phage terminase small subunit [Defluviitaleaceae bacterium]|nr:phage terminase small subunit [Defluviitaleaceae bacterium]